jgi:hypothetical protein
MSRTVRVRAAASTANTGSDATRNGIQSSETGATRKRLRNDAIAGDVRPTCRYGQLTELCGRAKPNLRQLSLEGNRVLINSISLRKSQSRYFITDDSDRVLEAVQAIKPHLLLHDIWRSDGRVSN